MRKLAIIGAGGHGRVVADCATACKVYDEIIFLDDCYPERTQNLIWPIKDSLSALNQYTSTYDFIIALGNNALRQKIMVQLQSLNANIISLIHPSASIASQTKIGKGVVVFANAVVNIGAEIGDGVIVNTGATVDHDCQIEAFVHISPGVNIAGGVKVGKYSWLGIGCAIVEYIELAENTQVGAGGVIHKSTHPNNLYVGIPATAIKALPPVSANSFIQNK